MPTIRVSKEILEKLTRLKGKLMTLEGREVTFEDAIVYLLKKAGEMNEKVKSV
jgi:hypothetical protein